MKQWLSLSQRLGRAVRVLARGASQLGAPVQTTGAVSTGTTMHKSYTWEYRIDVPPYDKLMEVLEAFFCSYPGGDYSCESRQRFKLQFRRGAWHKSLLGLGDFVPDRLIPGQFNRWPVLVHVLSRPSPEVYRVTVRYELHLPKWVPSLIPEVQASVDLHIRQELLDLSTYLAECIGLPQPPAVAGL